MFHLIFQPENSVLAVENALFSCSSAAGTCVEYVLRRLFFLVTLQQCFHGHSCGSVIATKSR